jgi:hypothetical protein
MKEFFWFFEKETAPFPFLISDPARRLFYLSGISPPGQQLESHFSPAENALFFSYKSSQISALRTPSLNTKGFLFETLLSSSSHTFEK